MNMYNAIFGKNKNAEFYLSVLGLTEDSFYRFRDCSVTDDFKIAVYTRGGGSNHEYDNSDIDKHPLYLDSIDDHYDSTYCTIYFSIPDEVIPLIKTLENIDPVPSGGFSQQWRDLIDNLEKKDKENMYVQRALEIGNKMFSNLK